MGARQAADGLLGLAAALLLAPVALAQEPTPEEVLSGIVGIHAKIQADARSAQTLGHERRGSGALIREGLVLTIGYLVIEAESIQVTGRDSRTVRATLAAYDHATGFGLLKLSGPLAGRPLTLGDASGFAESDQAIVASANSNPALVEVASRRLFTGNWEYLLESAIFTSPPVSDWSGAALIGRGGELIGLGSLVVPDAGSPGTRSPGNMFVPVDVVKPILEDLVAKGRRAGPARPWLGLNTEHFMGRLFVARVSPDGPAARAGLEPGDIVLGLGGEPVTTQESFYRRLWAQGAAGAEVQLRVLKGMDLKEVRVRSIDRVEYFRPSKTY
ncbi:MAG TPA: S1C family serine protease [Burkholderiales bacterium]|nr:S1C family serine protease [Burkholderiales bacterium]